MLGTILIAVFGFLSIFGVCVLALMQNAKDTDERIAEILTRKNRKND